MTSSPPISDKQHSRPKNAVLRFLKELVFVVVGAVIVSSLLRAFVGQMFIIPSQSMENTLLIGDRVVVQKLTEFHRGDVIVFEDPGGWLPSTSDDEVGAVGRFLELIGIPVEGSPGHLIKRLIGTPGDIVVCCDDEGRVTVNGEALDETSYLYRDSSGEQVAPSDVQFKITVPKEHVFVMGDHRDLSADSRCHLSDVSIDGRGQGAFVPTSDIVGPAFAIVSPLDRAKRLKIPNTFSVIPSATETPPVRGTISPSGVSC